MTKRDKSRKKEDDATGTEMEQSEQPRLSEMESHISLICLRYFRGNWDQYIDYLSGIRVAVNQRREELPLVEKLRDMDMRTGYLENILLDEVLDSVEHIDFDGLMKLWDVCMMLDPESDPFHRPSGEHPDSAPDSDDDHPPRMLH